MKFAIRWALQTECVCVCVCVGGGGGGGGGGWIKFKNLGLSQLA